MVHELCHLFSMDHCIFYECNMNGVRDISESMRKTKSVGGSLCTICLKKLQLNLQFDPIQRYLKLLEVCYELEFTNEAMIYERILDFLGICVSDRST